MVLPTSSQTCNWQDSVDYWSNYVTQWDTTITYITGSFTFL